MDANVWGDPQQIAMTASDDEAWDQLLAAVQAVTTVDGLCIFGTVVGGAVLQRQWRHRKEAVEEQARTSRRFE